ncbi:NAD(P)-dependent oxidoreductase, partial [Pantoea ananatis]|uniref:NAD(P)-dependent oxidoreductase n=1 Tax=Pantoea ananas TaxID=553 RepID=UPI00265D7A90
HTRNLIDARELSLLGKHAVLINVARGGVVNEKALYNALNENTFLGAASDVFEHERKPSPLFTLNNFIGTPHIGAMSHESQEKIAELIIDYLQQQPDSPTKKKLHSHALVL